MRVCGFAHAPGRGSSTFDRRKKGLLAGIGSLAIPGVGPFIGGLWKGLAKGVGMMASNTTTPAPGSLSSLNAPEVTRTSQTEDSDIATKAKDKAQAVAQAAADTLDRNRESAARVLGQAASTIHDGATRLPGGEGVARLAGTAAQQIDATARYVREHDTRQMLTDLKQFVRRHPGPSILGAMVVGILVGLEVRKH
jgi:hypothetical protein